MSPHGIPRAARRAGCGRSTATAARSPPAPNFAYELCATRIDERDLEGLDLSSLAHRLQRRRAGEPRDPRALRRALRRATASGAKRCTPVYGLAECAVGLAFPPLGRGPLVDRVDREPLARIGPRGPGARRRRHRAALRRLRRPLPGHEIRIVDADGARAARARRKAASSSAGRRRPAATSAIRARRASSSTATGSIPATSATSPAARPLHHRPRQGRDHPRRPQHPSLRARGGGRPPPGRAQGLRRRVRRARSGDAAPSGSWCSPRSRLVAGPERDALRAAIADTRDRLAGRARRTTSCSPRPTPCSRPRAARSAAPRRRELYERGPHRRAPPGAPPSAAPGAGRGLSPRGARVGRRLWSCGRRAPRLAGGAGVAGPWCWRPPPAWRAAARRRERWRGGRRPARRRRASSICPARPLVLAANHASYLDGLVLVAALPVPALRRQARTSRPFFYTRHFSHGRPSSSSASICSAAWPMPAIWPMQCSAAARCSCFRKEPSSNAPDCCRFTWARFWPRRGPWYRWCRWRCAARAACCRAGAGGRSGPGSRSTLAPRWRRPLTRAMSSRRPSGCARARAAPSRRLSRRPSCRSAPRCADRRRRIATSIARGHRPARQSPYTGRCRLPGVAWM